MATALSENAFRPAFRASFFFWIALAMAFFIFSGFGLTYWQPMATGTLQPLPPIVHLHGFFFSLWMLLLVTQAGLIGVKNIAWHRSLGTFGIAVATGVLLTGAFITLLFGAADSPDTPRYYDLMYLGITALLGFGTLFTLAIRQVRKPDNHRRLILLATIPLLPPGINRLYQVAFSLSDLPVLATYLTMDVLLAAILIHDWRTLGKISQVSLLGGALIVAMQLLHVPVSGSGTFAGICQFLTDQVYYR